MTLSLTAGYSPRLDELERSLQAAMVSSAARKASAQNSSGYDSENFLSSSRRTENSFQSAYSSFEEKSSVSWNISISRVLPTMMAITSMFIYVSLLELNKAFKLNRH